MNLKFWKRNKVAKSFIRDGIDGVGAPAFSSPSNNPGRGINVYTLSQLLGIGGKTKDGSSINVNYEMPYYYLTIDERLAIYRLCSPVFAVVTSRMNRISGMSWDIALKSKKESEIVDRLKYYKEVAEELGASTKVKDIVTRGSLIQKIRAELPEMKMDMSNFDSALIRWSRTLRRKAVVTADEIKEWMQQPNIQDDYLSFTKKYVYDLLIHGASCVYKDVMDKRIENIYILPGGTVYPARQAKAGGIEAFVQIVPGFQTQIFFGNEITYQRYLPSSALSYGFIPLEALVNKVTETLLFDNLMASQADGTKYPEKMVIITNPSPFSSADEKEFNIPIAVEEQERIEEKLNTPKKGAIMTFTGNQAQVVDLSRENTMGIQTQRQKDIREEVGMVFQATPMEMSLSGGDNTSGRSTSEAQEQIYHSSGILPVVRIIESFWNNLILPFRYGNDFDFKMIEERSESEQMDTLLKKMNTGVFSVNEIRNDLNEEPFKGEEFDRPKGAAAQQQQYPGFGGF